MRGARLLARHVDEVVLDDGAALRPVALAAVDGARVVVVRAAVVADVEADVVVAAVEGYRLMARVVDEVVRRAAADAAQLDARTVVRHDLAEMVDMVVVRHVARGRAVFAADEQDMASVVVQLPTAMPTSRQSIPTSM